MKTKPSFPCLLSHPLRLALVLALCPLAAGTARAENPFKVLGAKAKQGLTRVTRAVNPRRIGAALRNVRGVDAETSPKVRMLPVRPPASYPAIPAPDVTYYHVDGDAPVSPTGYYTGSYYKSGPNPDSSSIRSSTAAPRGMGPPPLTANPASSFASPAQPVPPAAPIRGTPSANLLPLSETSPRGISAAAPDAPKETPSRETAAPAPSRPVRPAPPRQDLPFGELVPGKTGFVHSPYSKTDLVDVSGIPTGTKVKCPYTGKTFRVP